MESLIDMNTLILPEFLIRIIDNYVLRQTIRLKIMLVPCNEWIEQLHYHSILFGCMFFSSVRYVNYLQIKYIPVVAIHPDNFLP